MTRDKSRLLNIGDRVKWNDSLTDHGTVIDVDWRGVTIKWDDGQANTIFHNAMAPVERVPVKV